MLSTSLLLVGIPFALAYVDEHQALEIEREQKARETAGEVSCWNFVFDIDLEDVTCGFLSFWRRQMR